MSSQVMQSELSRSVRRVLHSVNAVRPFARRNELSPASFFDGWLRSELPLHFATIATAANIRALRKGALKEPSGLAAVALNATATAMLIDVHRKAKESPQLFDLALAEALGDDYDSRILDGYRHPVEALTWKRLAQPFAIDRPKLTVARNLSYGERGRRTTLDVWRDPSTPADGAAPVLLQIHGGGWMIGNKEEQGQPLMTHLTRRGWICVAINYGLSPRSTWPDHIIDVKRAIKWIKENIASYGGNPDFIAVTGGSAGGHLSALAALTANDARFQPGFEDVDTTLQAAVPMYGVFDFLNHDGSGRRDMERFLRQFVFKNASDTNHDLWRDASPIARVHAGAPPFLVIHGENDSLAPVEQARSFVGALRGISNNPVAYVELPGTQHAFDIFWSPRTHSAVHAIERFLNVVRSDVGYVDRVLIG